MIKPLARHPAATRARRSAAHRRLEGVQLQRFGGRRIQPRLDFLTLPQNDRHRLGMDRGDDRVRVGRQECEDIVLALIERFRPKDAELPVVVVSLPSLAIYDRITTSVGEAA